MPYALDETSTVTAFPRRYRRNRSPEIVADSPERALSATQQPASDSQGRSQEAQTELAHANRVEMLGHLSASIAHELNQPISALIINAQTALRLLSVQPINMETVRRLLTCIVKDGMRTGEIVDRTRALIKKAPPRQEYLDINAAIVEAIEVTHHELVANGVSVQLKLAKNLPLVCGDRVQLQQVMLNLIINAIEAMSSRIAGASDLLIRTERAASDEVIVAVQDSGSGIDPANLMLIFDDFFSTKTSGLGMGLSICRAIIEAHGGKLWATSGALCGAVLQFALPIATDNAVSPQH
jgi:C4-dicarboxylate-specific signal transduction histidine kinase